MQSVLFTPAHSSVGDFYLHSELPILAPNADLLNSI